jgi:V/A-type H+-transporting ATPase subunit I
MLKVQLLGHDSVRDEVKRYLRGLGVLEITDVALERTESPLDEESLREYEYRLEQVEFCLDFLTPYVEKRSFLDKMGAGPIVTKRDSLEELDRSGYTAEIWKSCSRLEKRMRGVRDRYAGSGELVHALAPWIPIDAPFDSLSTDRYTVRLWSIPERAAPGALEALDDAMPRAEAVVCAEERGRVFTAVIVAKEDTEMLGERFKALGGVEHSFSDLSGTPNQIIESELASHRSFEETIGEMEGEARKLAGEREKLLVLQDYYIERIGLGSVEKHFHRTESAFVVEGWLRASDRRSFERGIKGRFDDIELYLRQPEEGEEPPIALTNRPFANPFEFVTTLYGRPVYRETDPTPLLAPFFILFFALCLTDAGYGLALSAVSALILIRFKPSGGAAKLIRLLFMGGLVTAAVGIITGGIFGIEVSNFPPAIRGLMLINPLEEPMKMLNIAFLLGLFHMLFGMGIRMVSNFRAGSVMDALFGDLLWILFLVVLAPLGFSAILGGYVPPHLLFWSKRASLVLALLIFLSGGRGQKGIVKRFFKGLIGFYDVVGYFGDVLSYARLLALGLATSAIALAVNGIAAMVKGLPFYTGYIAAALILVLGHGFNMAVNTLGAFVHSGRLQYLEFFSKFFTGGGREFRPFSSERRHSVVEEIEK